MNGPIQPWGDESTHIPYKLFQKKQKANNLKVQSQKKLTQTQLSVRSQIKTVQCGLTFHPPKQNQQRIFTLGFSHRQQINSIPRQVLTAQPRKERVLVYRRNKKTLQIGDQKKKIINLHVKSGNQLLVYKALQKRLYSELTTDDLKHRISQKIQSNNQSLLVKQAHITLRPKRKSSLFFRTIASLNQERNKLEGPQISTLNHEMHFQRKMFLKNNQRFRSWQALAKHNFSLQSTHDITFKTLIVQ